MRPRSCRFRGCDWHFAVDDKTLRWDCARCGRAGGSRRYNDPGDARRMAEVCNRGAAGPPLGLLAALGGTLHREPKQPRRSPYRLP